MRFERRCYAVEDFEVAHMKYKRDFSAGRAQWYQRLEGPWEDVRDPSAILKLEDAYETWCHEQAERILA